MRQLAALAFILTFLLISVNLTRATCNTEEECQAEIAAQNSQLSSIQKQQADLQRQLDAAKKSLTSTTAQLNDLQKQVDAIRAQLTSAEADLKNAQGILDQNKALFRARVRDFYMSTSVSGWELLFGGTYSFVDAAQTAGIKQAIVNKNKSLITQYTVTVRDLDLARAQIAESEKTATSQLAQIQAIRNAQSSQISGIQKTQSSLNTQVAQINANIKGLTVKQQEILAAKLAATAQNSTVGGGAPPTTTLPPAPFSPSFTFLTYGYPHRIGMNQYGAYGRAKAGQSSATILAAYYGSAATTRNDLPATISTDQGVKNFETDYMYGIAEMPTYWADQGGYEALKAQAVAARTYALYYIGWPNNAGTICTTQSCQVYYGPKVNDAAAAKWRQAVDETRGQIIMAGSSPKGTFYSSTDGGYTCVGFQNVDPCVVALVDSSSGGWGINTAWDGPGHGNSPWFHKAWGDRAGGSAYNPWLNAEETADMFNATTLSKHSSTYNQYLSPIDKGGWSMQQVRDELAKLGKPVVDAASAVGYGFDGQGNTTAVSVVGNNGVAYSLGGKEFRSIFNLRSRGTLAIWTSFFDVQRAN